MRYLNIAAGNFDSIPPLVDVENHCLCFSNLREFVVGLRENKIIELNKKIKRHQLGLNMYSEDYHLQTLRVLYYYSRAELHHREFIPKILKFQKPFTIKLKMGLSVFFNGKSINTAQKFISRFAKIVHLKVNNDEESHFALLEQLIANNPIT